MFLFIVCTEAEEDLGDDQLSLTHERDENYCADSEDYSSDSSETDSASSDSDESLSGELLASNRVIKYPFNLLFLSIQ